MSHNHEPERAARGHKPAIIAIVVALAVALIAFMVFTPGADETNDGIATTPPPAGTTSTEAEGNDIPAATAEPEGGTGAEPTPVN